jgi:hypothetical protein
VQYGDVFEGELIAEYTLGNKKPTPDRFWVVVMEDEQAKPLRPLQYVRIKTGYRVTLDGCEGTLDVPDPAWR